METWFIIIVSICISALIKSTLSSLLRTSKSKNHTTDNTEQKPLPPGPPSFPIIGNSIWLRKSISDMESVLRELKTRYGSLITMKIGPRTVIFVSNHSLAHRALVQNGAVCSDRPSPPPTSRILDRRQKSISAAAYGPTWRLLRRNLTHEILNPARVRSHSGSRRYVLSVLVNRIVDEDDQLVRLIDHFQYAIFCLLAMMCFGEGLSEEQIKAIESVQRRLILGFRRFNVLNFLPPRLSKVVFGQRWKELVQFREDQYDVFYPLIKARLEAKQQRDDDDEVVKAPAYVDTLVDLQLPEEDGRKLDEWEMVSLCSEFLVGGTDTTSTALQWIMANLVKNLHYQAKLYDEIVSVVGPPPPLSKEQLVAVEEEDLHKMPYLKAVVLEGLRRHPPGHFVLPHKVTQDIELDGYVVPKNHTLNFMVADMNWDPKVWEDPLEFKPERFLESEAFDVTGSKEIKMMPFGAGRRICPAWSLALLHLEYFVANLIWYFEWTSLPGEEIDLSEKQEFTIVMKNALRARISRRTY